MNREQSMSSRTTESSAQAPPLGENAHIAPPQPGQPGPPEHQNSRSRNQVIKSGPLFISSKGIGWTSWKKRWFVLSRTSLVFFRSDPSAASPKGGEMNLTLGGIDLNSSASVEVKADKKLLTVFFPDGRDGRAFTLKAETLDDLYEWKAALETAVAQAPSASAIGLGQNGMFNTEQDEASNDPAEQRYENDRLPGKSMVIGRPVLLALEDIDGSPSFLEKALRFIEQRGVRVEGILRQAADVDHVYRRVHEYQQGKTEFSPGEDAHVIADCIKYILRELPSSPVPATCCTALLEAFRSDRNNRLNNMRTAILETFPEPNRRLLQRILLMMQRVAAHKAVNRMSVSAVAACMSPLLLRPLLAGECELEKAHMDVAGDGSFQLLQAAAAANHAQAIVITLLEEYDNIFGEGSVSPELFSDSDESYTGTEEGTDDDDIYDDDDDDDHEDASGTGSDYEHSGSETCSRSGDNGGSNSYDDKKSESSSSSSKSSSSSCSKSHKKVHPRRAKQRLPSAASHQHGNMGRIHSTKKQNKVTLVAEDDTKKSHRTDIPAAVNESVSCSPTTGNKKASAKLLESTSQARHQMLGQTSERKNPSMGSVDYSPNNEEQIHRLEDAKIELQNQIAERANHNANLQANLGKRKKELHERRLALEKDVARLQDQLQKEKDIGAALKSGDISRLPVGFAEKMKADIKGIALAEEKNSNLKEKVNELGAHINHQHDKNAALTQEKDTRKQETSNRGTMSQNSKDNMSKDTSRRVEISSKNEGQPNHNMDGANRDKDGKKESSSSNKNQNQHQHNDTSRGGTSNVGSRHTNSSAAESPALKSLGSSSKKSGKVVERRSQIANELENLDKGKGSSNQCAQSSGQGKGREEKNQGTEGSREDISRQLSSHTSLKGMQSGTNNKDGNIKKGSTSKSGKSATQNSDKEQKSENPSSQHIDGLKSEGQLSSKSADKGQQQDGKHPNTSSSKVTR